MATETSEGTCIRDANENQNIPNGAYTVVQRGTKYDENFRTYIKETSSGVIVSPFHDIPLKSFAEHLESGEVVGNSLINLQK